MKYLLIGIIIIILLLPVGLYQEYFNQSRQGGDECITTQKGSCLLRRACKWCEYQNICTNWFADCNEYNYHINSEKELL